MTEMVQVASEEGISRAVSAATAAFPAWRDMAASKRAACLLRMADLIDMNLERSAYLESIAMCQTISAAKTMIGRIPAIWRYYAGHAGKIAGQSFAPDADGTYKIVQYEPLGERE